MSPAPSRRNVSSPSVQITTLSAPTRRCGVCSRWRAGDRHATVAEIGKLGDVVGAGGHLLEQLVAAAGLDDPQRRVAVGPAGEHSALRQRPPPARRPELAAVDRPASAGRGPRRPPPASIGRPASVNDGRPVGSADRSISTSMRPMPNHPLTTRRAGATASDRRRRRRRGPRRRRAAAGATSVRLRWPAARRCRGRCRRVDDEVLADARQHGGEAVVVESHVSHRRTPPSSARRAAAPSPATAAT